MLSGPETENEHCAVRKRERPSDVAEEENLRPSAPLHPTPPRRLTHCGVPPEARAGAALGRFDPGFAGDLGP